MTIYYWKAATGSDALIRTHQDAIQRLIQRDYFHHDLEKLRVVSSNPIYSFRLNQTERLLFTTHQGYLHVLEHLPTHDYQKSRFLKKGVLRHELERLALGEEMPVLFSVMQADEERPTFKPSVGTTVVGLDYYQQQFIALSDEQSCATQTMALPLVINGAAGTGKTLVGLSLLSNALQANAGQGRYLYVSQSQRLVTDMQANWVGGFASDDTHSVQFKTYDALLPDRERTSIDFFNRWYGLQKDDARISLDSPQAYYQEFRVCSGFTREHYIALGARQSAIVDTEGRQAFYDLYEKFITYLNESSCIDPVFFHVDEPVSQYDLIVVDEAQNLSLHQHHQLAQFAKERAIVFCMDSHQNLLDANPVLGLLEQSFRQSGMPLTLRSLDTSRRYTQQVASALTHVMEMGRKMLGGKLDKHEALSMPVEKTADEGQWLLIQPSELMHQTWIQTWANSTQFAVVTTAEFVEEAMIAFHTPLVFTPEQVIGQEYPVIVVYKMWADEQSKAILKAIKPRCTDEHAKASTSLPKDKHAKSHHAYASWLNAYYIACSRAINRLVIVEEKTHHNAFFWDAHRVLKPSTVEIPASLESDWDAMAKRQSELGNEAIAQRIHQQKHGPANTYSEKPATRVPKSQKATKTPALPTFDKALGNQLILAAIQNNVTALTALLPNKRLDLNYRSPSMENNRTALMIACRGGQVEFVRTLLTCESHRLDLDLVNEHGYTALMTAISMKHTDVAQALLTSGKPLNIKHMDPSGYTALFLAIETNQCDIMCALLATNTFDINCKMPDGYTPILLASLRGHHDLVRALLQHNPRPELHHSVEDNYTALMFAAREGHVEIVAHLIIACKNLSPFEQKNMRHEMALMLAIQARHFEVIKKLVYGDPYIDPNALSQGGYTALMYAIRSGELSIVNLLLVGFGHTLTINRQTPNGENAFTIACGLGRHEIAKQLLYVSKRMQVSGALQKAIRNKPDHLAATLDVLLSDERGLKDAILSILSNPALFSMELMLLAKLMRMNSQVWSILKSHAGLNLTKEEHVALLQTIMDSAGKHPLHIVLFKAPSPKQAFFKEVTTASSIIEKELRALLTEGTAHEKGQGPQMTGK